MNPFRWLRLRAARRVRARRNRLRDIRHDIRRAEAAAAECRRDYYARGGRHLFREMLAWERLLDGLYRAHSEAAG